ncbi:MotA/TolQ/ExbB proton channel family protein [Oscillospiraceae bacterium OttesenSCG-928-G22]|nr:MotA/TolQ/ExbB proton channel family protein [Oscillospiraceae bacterium OttesenSCG-928-G22]
MDITTIIGLVAGVTFILLGIITGDGRLMGFVDAGSIMVVLGGTVSAIFVSYPMRDIISIGKVAGQAFKAKKVDLKGSIGSIIDLANVARKEGLLALEESVKTVNDPFLQKGIMLIVDGTDPELVKGIMEAEISFIEARHQKGAGLFDNIAAFGPAFGMIGTLIGLIIMLDNLDDPSALGPGMSVALVTTFYGSVLANLVATPIATKLKLRSAEEILHKELMLEGMLSIQAGENPRIIEEKLYSFMARSEQSGAAPSGDGERG